MHVRPFRLLPLLLVLVGLLLVPPTGAQPPEGEVPPPTTVTVAGTIQSVLGCPADWEPSCDRTFLTYDAEDDLWQGVWELPAGAYEYKAALNGGWDENYGANATPGGSNISLTVSEPGSVRFLYDHKTHWIADSQGAQLVAAVGSFQSELGCARDDDPGCLRAWLQDPDGDGSYSFTTDQLPPGTYEVRVATDETGETIIGAEGLQGGPALPFTVPEGGAELFVGFDPATSGITVSTEGAPKGSLAEARAHWVTHDRIVWDVAADEGTTYQLHWSPDGALELAGSGVAGGEVLPLTVAGELSEEFLARFPHLEGLITLALPDDAVGRAGEILRGQVAVSAFNAAGRLLDATTLQLPGVLDDLFPYDGALGVRWEGDTPTLRLWAPTARSVTLLRFTDANPDVAATPQAMTFDAATGVWSVTGAPDWKGQFYLYEVEVFVPSTGRVERNTVTDPYSFSLAANSTRSQIVDLSDPALQPEGWDTLAKPPLDAPEDIVLYELHLRDFSVRDETVPPEHRGTFLAFTHADSAGMRHLRALAEAGLTHVHMLPLFDIATIEEIAANRQEADWSQLAALPPDSEQQQALLEPLRDRDGFNWGYDPFHFTVPEGSYSTDPNGPTRIREFRQMVGALNGSGLRVVMDVVYNHTNASGQDARSVLDRIVPGYYHRLNAEGAVETSTCCQNTATEHRMMEKLMVDSLVTWARQYKVDGFRFDLMGHHMVVNMQAVRAALDALTVEADGVDGRSIYLYGEGWDFGEVAEGVRGVNATQRNMAGTGIGTFNDRLRDAVRGGNPFADPLLQGFATGLGFTPNGSEAGGEAVQRGTLLRASDQIRAGLAGNLADFPMVDERGREVTAAELNYSGAPTGYTQDPQENIVYVSAHDNETLFDAVQLKLPPDTTMEARRRAQGLALSLTLFAQGVPFIHAGDELLRSKSLDGNSYNSGDWFNAIDWTGQTNNWAIGLPPAADNADRWPLIAPLLANPALRPTPQDIAWTSDHFAEALRIRRSTPLFRLRTGEQVRERLHFLNVGAEQVPGLIVMHLDGRGDPTLAAPFEQVLVLFNAAPDAVTWSDPALAGLEWVLHPIQVASADAVVRGAAWDGSALTVPGRTAAVFVVSGEGDGTVGQGSTVKPIDPMVDGGWLPLLVLGAALLVPLVVLLALGRRG